MRGGFKKNEHFDPRLNALPQLLLLLLLLITIIIITYIPNSIDIQNIMCLLPVNYSTKYGKDISHAYKTHLLVNIMVNGFRRL